MDYLTLLHPKFVHFPIALFLTAWSLDLLSWLLKKESMYKAAMNVYVIAAFFSVLALLTGLYEANRLHLGHPVLYAHRNYGIALTAAALVNLAIVVLFQKSNPKAARVIFTCGCLIVAVLVIAAGFLGGKLVYEYGIGVSQ